MGKRQPSTRKSALCKNDLLHTKLEQSFFTLSIYKKTTSSTFSFAAWKS